MGSDKQIMLATQINAGDDDPDPSGIYNIGTIANVLQLLKLPDGTVKVLVEGRARAEIVEYTDREEYYEARAVELAEPEGTRSRSRRWRARWSRSSKTTSSSTRRSRPKSSAPISQIEDYSKLADTVASHLSIKIAEKQDMLEITVSVKGGWKRRSA
jgi:ATP-dependent Lon protease